MDTTSASLLERLRATDPAATDWMRLDALYRPLVRGWLLRSPDLVADADDLTQEVFVVLLRELPAFRRQRDGAFRAWLRKVVVNRARTWRRAKYRHDIDPADGFLSKLEDPADALSKQWDHEHDKHVCERLLSLVSADFAPATWKAFRLFALDGKPVAEAARLCGLTENAVLVAKSRILRRLREEAAGLLD